MKILASAYACSPYDGSERAVGWSWVNELDKYHELTVITSQVYMNDIEDYRTKNPEALKNTKFIYISLHKAIARWHVGYRGERLYYILWQKKAYRFAKNIIKDVKFDLIHHLTYVTCVLPTYMHRLSLPFIYGPVSGGEDIPEVIMYPMNIQNKIKEIIRQIVRMFFQSTLNFKRVLKNSALIITTTEETKKLIPEKYQNKVEIFQAIGLSFDMFYPAPTKKINAVPKILVAGRMLCWKGFELAILSFLNALDNRTVAELTVLGDTDDGDHRYKEYLINLCGDHYDKEIKFVSRIDHEKMKSFYDEFDILLNCSLRDSGCFVVMEAMSRGLAVICVNTGGPKVNTTYDSAIKIEPAPFYEMIESIGEATKKLVNDEKYRICMGKKARTYAEKNFLMDNRTKKMNEFYESIVGNRSGNEKK